MNNSMHSEISGINGMKREGMERLRDSFEKYATFPSKESTHSGEESSRRKRARLANKIYRKVCVDSGLNQCFFMNFATWSDYVGGRISESEFIEKAVVEVEKMKASEAL